MNRNGDTVENGGAIETEFDCYIGQEEEIAVEIIDPDDHYPLALQNNSTGQMLLERGENYCEGYGASDFEDDALDMQVELPRGGAVGDVIASIQCGDDVEDVILHDTVENAKEAEMKSRKKFIEGELPTPIFSKNKERGEDSRLLSLIEAMKINPKLGRTFEDLKIPPSSQISKETTMDYIRFCLTNIDIRPKWTMVLSKLMSREDLISLLSLCFRVPSEDRSESLAGVEYSSLCRLYLKNSISSLKDLSEILYKYSKAQNVSIEIGEIHAELRVGGRTTDSKARYKTKDLKSYYNLEKRARYVGLNVITSFDIRQTGNDRELLTVRYYDEPKLDGTRSQYLHVEHSFTAGRCVKIADEREELTFEVPDDVDDEGVPLPVQIDGIKHISRVADLHGVQDLIKLLTSFEIGESSL